MSFRQDASKLQKLANNAFCQTGTLAALADSGTPDPDKLQKALEQTAAQFERAALEVRKLCERYSTGTGGYGSRPVLPPMEIAGSVELLGYNWLHITLNTLLPHCRFQPPEWLSDTIRRLLDEYEAQGCKLPFFNRALLVIDEHTGSKGRHIFDQDNKGYKAVSNAIKGRLIPDDDQQTLGLALLSGRSELDVCHITLLDLSDAADFFAFHSGDYEVKHFYSGGNRRKGFFDAGRNMEGGSVCVIFSHRDVDILKLLCWCQFIQPRDLRGLASDAERKNLMGLGLIRRHEKSGALLLTNKGQLLLEHLLDGAVPQTTRAYHPPLIERRVRVSRLVVTAYHGGMNPFTLGPEELDGPTSLFLPTIARSKGSNPRGSTRVAAIAHLGESLYAMHYVCPGIGKVALMDELAAFSNQTARFRNMNRAFLFAGDSYKSVLSELDWPMERKDTKLLTYGGAYRCLQLPVHLLSCDATGAVQLQIMAVPDYRTRLTKAALKGQYRPPPDDVPEWDAMFQGVPFLMAADMDLRRINAAIRAAKSRGFPQIAMAALEGQAEQVLFPRCRDKNLARVFVLTPEAISAVTGRKPAPYVPPRTQFTTAKGDVADAPLIQAHRKTGRSP